jgi:DNA-binding XRE family transcriptional regulator
MDLVEEDHPLLVVEKFVIEAVECFYEKAANPPLVDYTGDGHEVHPFVVRASGSCGDSAGAICLWVLICYHLCYIVSTYVVLYSRKISNMEVDVDTLQELRINQGLSQRRLAELAGVSNTSVWKIEQGGGANPATLKKLADVLGVRPVDLLKQVR